jgi:hypothetical protein
VLAGGIPRPRERIHCEPDNLLAVTAGRPIGLQALRWEPRAATDNLGRSNFTLQRTSGSRCSPVGRLVHAFGRKEEVPG